MIPRKTLKNIPSSCRFCFPKSPAPKNSPKPIDRRLIVWAKVFFLRLRLRWRTRPKAENRPIVPMRKRYDGIFRASQRSRPAVKKKPKMSLVRPLLGRVFGFTQCVLPGRNRGDIDYPDVNNRHNKLNDLICPEL